MPYSILRPGWIYRAIIEMTNVEIQISTQSQNPNVENNLLKSFLDFVIWILIDIWDLDFGFVESWFYILTILLIPHPLTPLGMTVFFGFHILTTHLLNPPLFTREEDLTFFRLIIVKWTKASFSF